MWFIAGLLLWIVADVQVIAHSSRVFEHTHTLRWSHDLLTLVGTVCILRGAYLWWING